MKLIPDVVSGQTIWSLRPTDSALHAARTMRERGVSALVVLDDTERLIGIVTQQDLVWKVLAEERQAAALNVSAIMTADPEAIDPDASPFDALEQMRKLRVRHLPVVTGQRVVGMVSMRDLRHAVGATASPRGKSALGRLLRVVSGRDR